MPRRHRRDRSGPEPLRPIGSVTPPGEQVEGWSVRLSSRTGATCPYCSQPIAEGRQHIVAWPEGREDFRRHWHRGCWERELRRGGPTL